MARRCDSSSQRASSTADLLQRVANDQPDIGVPRPSEHLRRARLIDRNDQGDLLLASERTRSSIPCRLITDSMVSRRTVPPQGINLIAGDGDGPTLGEIREMFPV